MRKLRYSIYIYLPRLPDGGQVCVLVAELQIKLIIIWGD